MALGLVAGDREGALEIVGEDQRHAFRRRRRIFGHSFVPGNAPLVIKLEVAIILEVAVLAADGHGDGTMRVGIGREDERAVAFRIEGHRGDGGIGTELAALLPAFHGHALEAGGREGDGRVALHVGAIVRRDHGNLAAQGLLHALLGVDADGIEVQIALGGLAAGLVLISIVISADRIIDLAVLVAAPRLVGSIQVEDDLFPALEIDLHLARPFRVLVRFVADVGHIQPVAAPRVVAIEQKRSLWIGAWILTLTGMPRYCPCR